MIGVIEGLLYAYRAGLDLDQTIQAVAAGAAGSWSISNYGPRIVKRNYELYYYLTLRQF
jgi:3-hydroxyisobutyrate dehydrogenase